MPARASMIKILVLVLLCAYGGQSSALQQQAYETFDDVANDAEIVEAAGPLPGTSNLGEKRVPVRRLTIPGAFLGLYGIKNLGERNQVPLQQALLPGTRNLDEKALPESLIRASGELGLARHPKSEVEKVR